MTSIQRTTLGSNTPPPLSASAKITLATPLKLTNLTNATSIDARQLLRNSISSPIARLPIALNVTNNSQEKTIQQFMRLVGGSVQQRQWMAEDLRYVFARDRTGQAMKLIQQAIIHNVKITFQNGFAKSEVKGVLDTAAEYSPQTNTVILNNQQWGRSVLSAQALRNSPSVSINGSPLLKADEYAGAIRMSQLLHELGHATVRNNATQRLRNQGNFTEEIAVEFVSNDILRTVFPAVPLEAVSSMYGSPREVSNSYLKYYQDNWLERVIGLLQFDFTQSRNLWKR